MTLLPEVLGPEGDQAMQLKDRLITINKTHGDLVLENGLLLKRVLTDAIYKEWGFQSFDAAIDGLRDQGLLTYGARNARNFVAVVDMFSRLQLGEEHKQLAISKLREIATLKRDDDQRDVIDRAADLSVSEVVAAVKAIKDMRAGRETDPFKPRTLKFSETQSNAFDEIIAATRVVHSINDNVPAEAILIDVIMADWMAGLPRFKDDGPTIPQ